MPTQWRWVLRATVMAVHDRLLADYGGFDGILSLDGLEGALGRPQSLANYGHPEPDAADLTATYAIGIAKSHAFVDGNKRTAWAVANTFLLLNGLTLGTVDDPAAVLLMVQIADGQVDHAAVAAWFRDRLQAL